MPWIVLSLPRATTLGAHVLFGDHWRACREDSPEHVRSVDVRHCAESCTTLAADAGLESESLANRPEGAPVGAGAFNRVASLVPWPTPTAPSMFRLIIAS